MRVCFCFDNISDEYIKFYADLEEENFDDLTGSIIEINKFVEVLDSIKGGGSDCLFMFRTKGLDGVLYGIYADDDIYYEDELIYRKDELIDKIVSEGGKCYSDKLVKGFYYIKELETLPRYSLDKTKVVVKVDGQDKIYNVDFSIKRSGVLISYRKKLDNNKSSSYKLGLYNSFDIYNEDGELLFIKDSLIKTYTSNIEGRIDFAFVMPCGTYYLRELDSCNRFVDNNIYEFSLDFDGENGDLFITREPVSDRKNTTLIVKNNNLLDSHVFKICDSSGKLVYVECIMADQMIDVGRLENGKYSLFLVSDVNGIVCDEKVCDFLVDFDNEIIEIVGKLGPELLVGFRFDDRYLSIISCCKD